MARAGWRNPRELADTMAHTAAKKEHPGEHRETRVYQQPKGSSNAQPYMDLPMMWSKWLVHSGIDIAVNRSAA